MIFLAHWLSCRQGGGLPLGAGLASLVVSGEEMTTSVHLLHMAMILAIS
jgi:hypothetical protein